MGIYQEVVDFNELFSGLNHPVLIVNDFDTTLLENKEKLNDKIFTRYNGDSLSIVPSCECGETKGEYFVDQICEECGSRVLPITEKPLEAYLWMRAPKDIRAFFSPVVWHILNKAFTKRSLSIIHWLCSSHYRPAVASDTALITSVAPPHWKRSINFFIDNFDEIIEKLMILFPTDKASLTNVELAQFIKENRHKLFCQYLPIPSKICFITESTSTGLYVDTTIFSASNAIRTISAIEYPLFPLTQAGKETRTVKIMDLMDKYYQDFITNRMSKKEGLFRKHYYAGRTNFTGRAVITSIQGAHRYDELHIPWSLAVQVYKLHLTNKLRKRGMTPRAIQSLMHEYVTRYHPLIDELLLDLIQDYPGGQGMPCLFHRNPLLERGSMQNFYVTKVYKDPSIHAFGISPLALKAPNADFDGDEMNFRAINDVWFSTRFSRLSPHLYVMDIRHPMKISDHIAIPVPILSTLNNWVNQPDFS